MISIRRNYSAQLAYTVDFGRQIATLYIFFAFYSFPTSFTLLFRIMGYTRISTCWWQRGDAVGRTWQPRINKGPRAIF